MAWRRPALYLGTSVASLLLFWVLAEGLTRLALPFSTVEYRIDSDVGQILVANQQTRWVHEDYDQIVITNRAGFHDVEHQIEKPSDVFRIVVVGDSFIEALSSSIDLGVTQRLEQLLQRAINERRVEVINVGVSGTGPCQQLRMLEVKGMAYRPNLVIMSVFPENDFWDSEEMLSASPSKVVYRLQPDSSLKYVPADNSVMTVKLRPWIRKSAFLSLLRAGATDAGLELWLRRRGVLGIRGVTSDEYVQWGEWGAFLADHPDPWSNAYRTTLHCIKASHELAVKGGAQFTVVLIGSAAIVEDRLDEALKPYPEAKSLKWDFEYPFTLIMELGKQTGFSVINLIEPFRADFRATKKSRSWPHDGHWNPAGNQLAAEVVSRHLTDHRKCYGLPN